ncbi:MAG: hypothetical protein WD738_06865, partial [Pirellulales bacterium]
ANLKNTTTPMTNHFSGATSYHELALSIGARYVRKLLATPLLGRTLPLEMDLSPDQVESVVQHAYEPDTPASVLREIIWTANDVTDADWREGFYYFEQIRNDLQREAAHAAELAGDRKPARIMTSVDPPYVRLDGGEPIPVTPDEAACLDVVLAAMGDWIGGPKITEKTRVARPDRVIRRLAKKLGPANPVQTRPRIGHRIAREWLS